MYEIGFDDGWNDKLDSTVGEGSTFSVLLQLALAPPQPRSPVHAGGPLPVGSAGVKLNILLAEDNLVNQKVAAKLLEKQGHRVTVVANGRAAVTASQDEYFDLILMDVQMPEMNGLEATQAIRKLERTGHRHIPIIAMTAQTMAGDRDSCFAAGMDGFVSKPIRSSELVGGHRSQANAGSAPKNVKGRRTGIPARRPFLTEANLQGPLCVQRELS